MKCSNEMEQDMTVTLRNSEAEITVLELPGDKRQITISSDKFALSEIDKSIETRYPLDLIQKILDVKGARALNDEIRREEDPLYTKACLQNDITAYQPDDAFKDKTILDFGCGAGASTLVLSRMFPDARIVGIDLSDKLISLAKARAEYYQYDNVSFLCSPDSKTLPENIGEFDYVVLSAVYEHLLPDEREPLLRQIWFILKPDGIFFLNQTPYRFFPLEGHTTQLLFINYLPKKAARFFACKYSKKVKQDETWQQLLRRGIRGGYPREILGILKRIEAESSPVILKPSRPGFRDRIDIWYWGYAVCIANKYPKMKKMQRVLRIVAKIIYAVSGIVFLPTVSVAIKKKVTL